MIRNYTIDRNGASRIAAGFILFLFLFEVYVVGVNYSQYFVYLFDNEGVFFSAIAIVFFFIAIYLCFYFVQYALSAAWPYRLISMLIFAFSLLVEYGYQKALGRFSDRIDIETAIAATPEQQTTSLMMYLNWRAVIPCAVLFALFIFCRPKRPGGLRGFLLVNLLFVLGFAAFPFLVDQKFQTLALGASYRTTIDFLINGPLKSGKWASKMTGVELRRRVVAKPDLPPDHRPSNNLIIVVDESVMGDHLSLNGYQRKTTPFLDELQRHGILRNWGIAAASSTGSRWPRWIGSKEPP